MQLVLTEEMPARAVETACARLAAAAKDLDSNRIAGLIIELAAESGVRPVWDQVCVPLLTALAGVSAAEVAVEHALSEGIRVGLDVLHRTPSPTLPPSGVLLAGADQELHCLGLHALAAALREKRWSCLLLGPALPWPALASAVQRGFPHTVVVWSQTPVTARAYRLVRLGRDFPAVRVFGAGPGWAEDLPAPASRLNSLTEAVAACLST